MSDSQTAYTLCIAFDLFPSKSQASRAADHLVYLVRRNAFKIATGFAGTPFICEALMRSGNPEIAYAMLLERNCPSWLYPITMGATTMWERWDSMLPDGKVNSGEMTSFNHYALGSVASFMYEHIAGLQMTAPGWKTFKVQPTLGGGIQHASASIDTPYGVASSSWRWNGDEQDDGDVSALGTLLMDIEVPPNTTGLVIFPAGATREPVTLGSGFYSFSVQASKGVWPVNPLSPW